MMDDGVRLYGSGDGSHGDGGGGHGDGGGGHGDGGGGGGGSGVRTREMKCGQRKVIVVNYGDGGKRGRKG